jgi:hypothetical protein
VAVGQSAEGRRVSTSPSNTAEVGHDGIRIPVAVLPFESTVA